jgi:hypothetical protein
MTGTDVMKALIDAAERLGYLVHHETDSRKTAPGFPDLLIVGHGTLFAIECKSRREKLRPGMITKRGKQLPGQADWLAAFASSYVATFVCRPDDAPAVDDDTAITEYKEINYSAMLSILTLARDAHI